MKNNKFGGGQTPELPFSYKIPTITVLFTHWKILFTLTWNVSEFLTMSVHILGSVVAIPPMSRSIVGSIPGQKDFPTTNLFRNHCPSP